MGDGLGSIGGVVGVGLMRVAPTCSYWVERVAWVDSSFIGGVRSCPSYGVAGPLGRGCVGLCSVDHVGIVGATGHRAVWGATRGCGCGGGIWGGDVLARGVL